MEQCPSLLDLVLTNEPSMIGTIVYESPLGKGGGHCCLRFSVYCDKEVSSFVQTRFIYDRANYDLMKREFGSVDWVDIFN